jgi:hypothetical protein
MRRQPVAAGSEGRGSTAGGAHNGASPSVIGWYRATGLFGIAWLLLFAIGGIVLQGEPPAYDQSVDVTRGFFAARADRYLLGDYIAGLAFILCFLPFITGLSSLLGAAEGGLRIAARLVFAGGLATVIVGDGATAFLDAVALADAATSLDDGTIRALLHANAVAIAAIGLPMALTAFAAAAVIWTTTALWRWLAPVAALAGLLHVAGAAYVIPDDGNGPLFFIRFGGLISFAVFVLFASINLINGPNLQVSSAPPTSSTRKPRGSRV